MKEEMERIEKFDEGGQKEGEGKGENNNKNVWKSFK